MKMKNSERRRKIFKVYSDNLCFFADKYGVKLAVETDNGLQPVDQPMYICPLCLRAYTDKSLDQKVSNPLTLEDLPPKSVGGSPKILTCKECNNKAGHSLDKTIAESLETESFIRGIPNSKINGIIKVNDGVEFRSVIKIEEHKRFNLFFNANIPHVKNDLDYLTNNWNNSKINFSFRSPENEIYSRSLLRIGFLLAFYYLGNRVLFEPNYHKIRDYINEQNQNQLAYSGVTIFPPDFDGNTGLHVLKEPQTCRSYLIIYQIALQTITKKVGVFFPGPGELGWTRYTSLQNIDRQTRFNFSDLNTRNFITNKNLVNSYDYIYWNN